MTPRHSVATVSNITALACALVAFALVGSISANEILLRSEFGGRLGVWINAGEKDGGKTLTGFEQDFSNANLYGEMFFSVPFSRFTRFEIALGVSNRSDISYNRLTDEYTGSANLYPLQLSTLLYPAGRASIVGFHPYLSAGAGLTFASQTVQETRSIFGTSKNDFDLGYAIGAGVNFPVGEGYALGATAKYHDIKFGGAGFLELNDYSGVHVTVGFSYFAPKKQKDDKTKPKPPLSPTPKS